MKEPRESNPEKPPATDASLDLTALDQQKQRAQDQRKRGLLGIFAPFSLDDLQSFKGLLRFVRPHRKLLIASFFFAFLAACFLGLQFKVLDEGLGNILGGPSGEVHECPKCAEELMVQAAGKGSKVPGRDLVESDAEKRQYRLTTHDASHEVNLATLAEEERRSRRRGIWLMAAALVLFVAVEGVCKYSQGVLMGSASRRTVMDLRLALFQHLMSLSMRFHQRNHSASLVSRITYDLTLMATFLTESLVRMTREGMSFFIIISFIIFKQGFFILVVAAIVAVAFVPLQILGRKLRKQDKAGQAGMEAIYRVLTEAFTGQRVVKAFGTEEREYERFRLVNRAQYKRVMKVRRLRSTAEPVVQTIGALGTAVLIVVGGERVLSGAIPPGTFFVMIFALGRAMASLRIISKQLTTFQVALAAADRVSTLLDTHSEIQEKPDAIELPPFSEEIRFDKVLFRHAPGDPTLNRVSFAVGRGRKIALVGPSGAGKSTVADLLPRFYDIAEGSITVDGVDIRDVTLRSLRDQIGIVSQDTVLFQDTVRNNICYGRPDATDEEVEAAARAANAHDFIMKTADGYESEVGERGLKISGGERQRLSIARALLKNPPILILDEATSALDSESEVAVQTALDRLMRNRTVLVIAHRLSTIRDADRIIVLDKGKKVEQGTHDQLMAKGGLYRRLNELQFQVNTSGLTETGSTPAETVEPQEQPR